MPLLLWRFYNKWFPPMLPSSDAFKDQTILITGATGGLGLETAVHYVQLGASRVIITARTLSKGQAAQTTIESRTGKTGIIEVRELEMSTFAGVKSFVDKLKEELKTIDVVLLNAGVFKKTYEVSPDGWEETLQVNTLSTIALGLLLLPWMRSCRIPSRNQHLGFVSSGLHTLAKIETDDFPKDDVLRYWSEEKHFSGSMYGLSKLCMMYGVAEIVKLAQLDDGSPSPIVNSTCPGLCRSDLGRQYTSGGSYLVSIGVIVFFGLFGKTAEAGARTFILAAMTSSEEHGKYVKHYGSSDTGYKFESANNLTSEAGKKLHAQVWKEMLQIFDAVMPEASSIARSESKSKS